MISQFKKNLNTFKTINLKIIFKMNFMHKAMLNFKKKINSLFKIKFKLTDYKDRVHLTKLLNSKILIKNMRKYKVIKILAL